MNTHLTQCQELGYRVTVDAEDRPTPLAPMPRRRFSSCIYILAAGGPAHGDVNSEPTAGPGSNLKEKLSGDHIREGTS